MILKILLCGLFLDGLLSYKINSGINIRDVSSSEDLLKVDEYLRKYGYLRDKMVGGTILASDADRKEALKIFQNFVKIPRTGGVDNKTIEVMSLPRCGCADVMRKDDSQHTKKSKENIPTPVEFNLGSKWPRNTISWRLNSFSAKISRRDVEVETRRAFDLWSKNANLKFIERSSGNADIVIDFARGQHGDGAGNAFDGVGRVLAHAFFPTTGDTHFDDDENWVTNRAGTDYFTVAAHEFGHALGLGHSEIRSALMAPFYTGYNPDFKLDNDDIRGIQALYGPPETEQPQTTRAPLVTSTPRTTTPVQPDDSGTTRPIFCTMRWTAVTRDLNGDLLAFLGGSYILQINERGLVNVITQRRRFGSFWPRFPHAAISVLSESSIMLLKGQLLRTFTRGSYDTKRLFLRGGNSMPEEPTAAISFSSNVATVFGTSQVWDMSPLTAEIYGNSYRYIRDAFPGVERIQLDSAVLEDDNTILFFSGKNVHTYDLRQRRVIGVEDKAARLLPNNCAL